MQPTLFGRLPDGRDVQAWTLGAPGSVTATILTYGARIASLRIDVDGTPRDIVLGFATLDAYVRDTAYLGAIVGRVGNRIAGGKFPLDGRTVQLATNDGPNTLHGGPLGFDRAVWDAEPDGASLVLRHASPDGDQGFPGRLDATVRYTVDGGDLRIDYEATTGATTIVNLTNHAYFNLDGSTDILGHQVTLHADRFTPTDAGQIPTGELRRVDGAPFDFRAPHTIGERIGAEDAQLVAGQGYDHNFVLADGPRDAPQPAAAVAAGGVTLHVLTTEPGLQFYSGNMMPAAGLPHRGALCLETQHFPDAPNHEAFPSIVLEPGATLRSTTIFRLSSH